MKRIKYAFSNLTTEASNLRLTGRVVATVVSMIIDQKGSLDEDLFGSDTQVVLDPIDCAASLSNTYQSVTNVIAKSDKMIMHKIAPKYVVRGDQLNEVINRWRMIMKYAIGSIIKLAMVATISLSAVLAQVKPKLDIQIADQKVNLSQAEQKDPSKLTYAPGDTLKYILTASNTGDGLMTNPEIVDPIPAGVTYIAESADGANSEITVSLNQGHNYQAWPAYYTVRNAKGILVKHKASPDMVTHIKWHINKNLKPGDAVVLEFLVVVNK